MKKEALIPVMITMIFIILTSAFLLIKNIPQAISLAFPEETSSTAYKKNPDDNKININTASRAQLMTLPGIGEKLAQRIIDYRESNGSFVNIEALSFVDGISDRLLEQIQDYITVGGIS